MEMSSERETGRESLRDLFRSVREAFPALNANVTRRADRTVSLPVLETKFSGARRIGAGVNGLSKTSPPNTIKRDWSIRSSGPHSSTKVLLESKKRTNVLILCQLQFQFYL